MQQTNAKTTWPILSHSNGAERKKQRAVTATARIMTHIIMHRIGWLVLYFWQRLTKHIAIPIRPYAISNFIVENFFSFVRSVDINTYYVDDDWVITNGKSWKFSNWFWKQKHFLFAVRHYKLRCNDEREGIFKQITKSNTNNKVCTIWLEKKTKRKKWGKKKLWRSQKVKTRKKSEKNLQLLFCCWCFSFINPFFL